MSFHYKNTEQITEIDPEAPAFVLPKFGESTTDPTYYEPMATAIANMRNSAQGSGKSLYDFEAGSEVPDIENVIPMIGRKPGMTQEEISQISTQNMQNIKSDIEADKENKKQKQKQQEEAVELSQALDKAREEGISVANND